MAAVWTLGTKTFPATRIDANTVTVGDERWVRRLVNRRGIAVGPVWTHELPSGRLTQASGTLARFLDDVAVQSPNDTEQE